MKITIEQRGYWWIATRDDSPTERGVSESIIGAMRQIGLRDKTIASPSPSTLSFQHAPDAVSQT